MAFNAIKFKYSLAKSIFGENTMAGRTLVQIQNPVTQSVDAIKNLLAYVGRASDPMPSDVSLDNGRLVLILSNKKDAYYTCTARACSCPGNQFRHNCKHIRKYFPQVEAEKVVSASEPLIQRGGFRPFDKMPREEVRAA
jgi:hypothetical protein